MSALMELKVHWEEKHSLQIKNSDKIASVVFMEPAFLFLFLPLSRILIDLWMQPQVMRQTACACHSLGSQSGHIDLCRNTVHSAHSLQHASSAVLCGGPAKAMFSLMLLSFIKKIKWRLFQSFSFLIYVLMSFSSFVFIEFVSFLFIHVSDFLAQVEQI